jgi:TetR/AcrR family transcriptional repressor of nem operon
MAIMEKRDTRNDIIKVGMELISTHGYSATGIGSVLQLAKVPKGSFYHYFPSKEAFGLAVIDRFAEGYERFVSAFLQEPGVPPLNRLRNYLEAVAQAVGLEEDGCVRGCLIGNLGQELAAQNETFRLRLEEIFGDWLGLLAATLEQAQIADEISADLDSRCMAGVLLSGLQGALLRSKVQRSAQPIRELTAVLFSRLLVGDKQ